MYGNHHVPTKKLIVMYITYVSLLLLHNVYNKQISIRASEMKLVYEPLDNMHSPIVCYFFSPQRCDKCSYGVV
jgi:hypothetical protein